MRNFTVLDETVENGKQLFGRKWQNCLFVVTRNDYG